MTVLVLATVLALVVLLTPLEPASVYEGLLPFEAPNWTTDGGLTNVTWINGDSAVFGGASGVVSAPGRAISGVRVRRGRAHVEGASMPAEFATAGVIGLGTMGSGIAEVLAPRN